MKTKIIYISGAEIFDMADIRAAFDEVRTTLGLDTDTVMFGVPVDADNALDTAKSTDAPVAIEPEIVPDVIDMVAPVATETTDPIIIDTPVEKPKKKSSRSKKASEPDVMVTESAVTAEQDAAPDTADTDDKVIPILSVLAASGADDDVPASETVNVEPEYDDVAPDTTTTEPAPGTSIVDIVVPIVAMDSDEINTTETIDNITDEQPADRESDIQTVSIQDMVADDTPAIDTTREKTLEELLESMAPLSEDNIPAPAIDTIPDALDTAETVSSPDTPDATLEQLATEFAQSQDKITPVGKNEGHGKIGKLKNILPFKKIKREDSGLMGDLFGWAGIAANDEDFSIPGFFTPSASRK